MFLSIITVNKNNASGLDKTIQSVISQSYTDFEFIIVDGNSTDGSVEVIKKNDAQINYWVSEPDTGIYNAMNKGIRKAQGEFCLFLNSGDWLFGSDSLEKSFSIIKNLGNADFYFGNCLNSDHFFYKMPNQISIDNLYFQEGPNHQNTFIKRSLFYDHGFYNENYPTVSDSIFFVKEFWHYHSIFTYINTIVSVYGVGGISSVYKYAQKELHQEMKMIMGDTEFNILAKRNKPKYILSVIKNFVNRLLPSGMVKFLKKHILKRKILKIAEELIC
jgi:glycosyltransferase involved in cell wall biosynthesis